MKKKALLIEDDLLVCKVLEKILHQRGMETVLAMDSQQAQAKCKESAADLAVISVDLLIPGGLSGWDMIEWLKARNDAAHIPIIVLTGSMISVDEEQRLGCQVHAVIRKQEFSVKSFGQLLDKLLTPDAKTLIESA